MKTFNLKTNRKVWILPVLFLIVALVSCNAPITPQIPTTNETTVKTPMTTNPSTITNHTPSFEQIGDKVVTQGEVLEFWLTKTDPEGDYLTINTANLPTGATFDNLTGYFHWIPLSTGIYPEISFTVSDGYHTISQNIIITVVPAIPPLINYPTVGTPLAIFYYGSHTLLHDLRILAAKPQYVIINSANSLWGQITGRGVLKDLDEYKESGIKVIGYITSGYEGSGSAGNIDSKWYTLEMNQKLIKQMAEIDHVDGVFIDECSPFPSLQAQVYLKTLTNLAHSYGLITWGNVGLAQFDNWFFTKGGFDYMQSDEDWHGQELSQVQRDWGYRISVTGTDSSYTAQDALRLTADARAKGLAFCYITDTGYDSLPLWFEDFAEMLQKNKLPITN